MMRRPPFTRRVLTGGHRSLRWTCGHGPDRDGCAGRVRRDHAAAPVRRHARHGASPREAPRRGVRFPPAGREGAWQAGGMTAAGMTLDERYRVIQSREDRKNVGEGKSVSVRVDIGGRRTIKKKKKESKRERTYQWIKKRK